MKQKEARARIKINELLKNAGWRFFDDENGTANIRLETNVKITEQKFNEWGENFEKTKNGFVDFLLLDKNGFPFVVLEAKSEDKEPLIGKEQAREYARSSNVKLVILSNGNQHYLWNIEEGNPYIILEMPTYETLEKYREMSKRDTEQLCNTIIKDDYIAVIKMSDYADDPDYKNPNTREEFKKKHDLRFLRQYQIDAVKAIQSAVKQGSDRFLLEMATGTGKTLTAAAIIRLFLHSGCANRILFLVDRLELENQAKKNFHECLHPDYDTVVFKENMDNWDKCQIVISTVQSLLYNEKYKKYFKPVDFNLVIADESHRSINGNARALFEYFWGYKLGLTATPKDYIKNVDIEQLKSDDPRAWEKRQILDTYKTFGCESGEPTFRYGLNEGVKDGILIQPFVVDARTNITTKLLSDEGYAVINNNRDDEDEEENIYTNRDFEKKFFSESTNRVICKTFIENAMKDPISNEIGKSIIFCVSRKHAARITQYLNEYAERAYPGKYHSDFAVQVTSDIPKAQEFTRTFQNNQLNGKTNFLEEYNSSKTRVCVTVGMMTTGYDCRDILNIGLMRPIFSPTDFIQIKGRGTRIFDFTYTSYKDGEKKIEKKRKERFNLFDFFANFEYFEEKFKYDAVIELPQKTSNNRHELEPAEELPLTSYTHEGTDDIKNINITNIDSEGMKIDREYFQCFEEKVKDDEYARQQYNLGNIELIKKHINQKYMNMPIEYFTMEKLREAIKINRRIIMEDIIDKIFGGIPFKNKEEQIHYEWEGFEITHREYIPSNKYNMVKEFFGTCISDKKLLDAIKEKKYTSISHDLSMYDLDEIEELGTALMSNIANYIQDNVNLSRFSS